MLLLLPAVGDGDEGGLRAAVGDPAAIRCVIVTRLGRPRRSGPHLYLPPTPGMERIARGRRVVVQGVKSKPELNGAHGRVLGWHAPKQRYELELDAIPPPVSAIPPPVSAIPPPVTLVAAAAAVYAFP